MVKVLLPSTFRLVIVRHAQTAANLDGTYCGRRDIELTGLGRQMAEMIPRNSLLAGVRHLVASPMVRAVATAAPLGKSLGLQRIPTDERLCELDFGEWDGQLPAQVQDQTDHMCWRSDPYRNAPPGGESGASVLARVLGSLAEELMQCPNLAVVTHKSPARLLATRFLGHSLPTFRSLSGFWVTSVTRIEVDPGQPPRVFGPSIDHLPPAWQCQPDRLNPSQFKEIAPHDCAP